MKQEPNKLDQTLGRALQWVSWGWQLDAWNKYKEMVIANRKAKTK